VDLKAALEGLPYDPGLSGHLGLAMAADPGAPWNDGGWKLSWNSGKLTVTKQEADASTVQMSPHVLAQLYIGYRSMAQLVDAGELAVHDSQRELLSRAFPVYPAYLDDWF
jgi:predicted acetyltransferase